MELRLTEQEALTLYRIILRWDELGSLTTEDGEEHQLLWDLSCTLEKELEPVMIMAFGYPAEPLERSYEDFRRIELKKLVTIRGAFGKVQRKLLEAARLAPSAMNRQPWRFVSSEDRIHLFVKKPGKLGYQTQQDFNLFDAGVALSHMLVTAEDQWFDLEYQKLDSILEKEFQNYVYVGSLLILNDSEKI